MLGQGALDPGRMPRKMFGSLAMALNHADMLGWLVGHSLEELMRVGVCGDIIH